VPLWTPDNSQINRAVPRRACARIQYLNHISFTLDS
jgi:hypothetical protein